MKVNEFIKKNIELLILSVFAISLSGYLMFTEEVGFITADSDSYIEASVNILNGEIHIDRTPVYPLLIGISKIVSRNGDYLTITVLIQHLLFLLSVCVFYKIARDLGLSNRISFVISLIYILLCIKPANYIMTESISISLMVFLTTFVLRIFKYGSAKDWIIITVILCLLVFTRPIFIYLLPILFICFCIIAYKKSYSFAFKGILCLVICSLSIMLYMHMFKREYGIFSPTRVSLINQYQIFRMNNLIDESSIENQDLKNDIILAYEQNGKTAQIEEALWNETFSIMDRHNLPDIKSMLQMSRKTNRTGYIKALCNSFYTSCGDSIRPRAFGTFLPLFGLSLFYIYLFVLFYLTLLSVRLFRDYQTKCDNKTPIISIFLCLSFLGNLAVAIIGAQSDWSRLVMPSIPFLLLMLGQVTSPLKMKFVERIEFQ